MFVSELIERKRDGSELSPEELDGLLADYLAGEVADYQMSAFLMAVFFRGLTDRELSGLTRAIIQSGMRLDFRDGGPPAVDKHSTGGVGDKVSLVLAPLLAEAGLRVPMISGRGLGHTGGTLDKLESIPGFRTRLDLDEFRAVLAEVGCAMIGQTEQIAPLDGRLYALRDVTGTVPSIPLIASSIVSKKVAEGIEGLVLDVKCGSGAFMREEEPALALARALVRLAAEQGLPATALVTGMDAPLGRTVGHALEVREAIECLAGGGPEDLAEVTLALGAELLVAVGEVGDRAEAAARLDALRDGRAAERFARLIERQGGDPRVVEDPDRLPAAPIREAVEATEAGTVAGIETREIGLTVAELGGGRRRVEDEIDPAVGLEMRIRPGDTVAVGEPLALLHARTAEDAARAASRIRAAVRIEPVGEGRPHAFPDAGSRLRYRVDATGVEELRRGDAPRAHAPLEGNRRERE